MDGETTGMRAGAGELPGDEDPTGESPALAAGGPAAAAPGVIDPNVLALRRVDAEIRRLMDSWVELEERLGERDAEIHRLRGWAAGLDADLRAARAELAAAHAERERLREEAREHEAGTAAERRQAEARLAEHRDAIAGLAERLRQAEKSGRGHDGVKAELAARIADLDQRCQELAGRCREAEAAGTLRLGELQAQLESERGHFLDQIAARDAVAVDLRQRLAETEAERVRFMAEVRELREQAAAVDSEFQAKRQAIAALAGEIDRLGMMQANVRKLDSMVSQQLAAVDAPPAEAEGSRNDRLIVCLDGPGNKKYPLYKPDMVIGRSHEADIRVTGPHTSRRHARVFVEDGAVWLEDLGSLNGVTVNDEAVRRRELCDGDVLDVGGARLRYVDLARHASPPPAAVQPAAPARNMR